MKKQTIIVILTSCVGILCLALIVCVGMLAQTSQKLNYHRNRYHEFLQLHRILADIGYRQDGLNGFDTSLLAQRRTTSGTYFVIAPEILHATTSPYVLSRQEEGYIAGATDFYGYFLECNEAGYVIASGLEKP